VAAIEPVHVAHAGQRHLGHFPGQVEVVTGDALGVDPGGRGRRAHRAVAAGGEPDIALLQVCRDARTVLVRP
jgi:hypothetical protein